MELKEKILDLDFLSFLENQKAQLIYRKENKTQILKDGGEASLSHSPEDISRIEYALKRIESGKYGQCCDCGCPIDRERLYLIPETPFCKPCADSNASAKAN